MKTGVIVERTLCDTIEWYARFVDEATKMASGCQVAGIAKYIRNEHKEASTIAGAHTATDLRRLLVLVDMVRWSCFECCLGNFETRKDCRYFDM